MELGNVHPSVSVSEGQIQVGKYCNNFLEDKYNSYNAARCVFHWLGIGGSPNHLARNPVPLQSEQRMDPFVLQIIQLVFFDCTSHSILSPIMKNPVPLHHLHSMCPFELQDEQATGLGCLEINQARSIRWTKPEELSDESTVDAFSLQTLWHLSSQFKQPIPNRFWRMKSLFIFWTEFKGIKWKLVLQLLVHISSSLFSFLSSLESWYLTPKKMWPPCTRITRREGPTLESWFKAEQIRTVSSYTIVWREQLSLKVPLVSGKIVLTRLQMDRFFVSYYWDCK